jgi:Cu/Ag efflux pump CusA
VLVMFDQPWRNDLENLSRLPIEIPNGPRLPLSEVADIDYAWGPNSIKRENSQRLISIRVNTMGRDLSSAVAEIQRVLQTMTLPTGYVIELGGQYQAQQSASRAIGIFSLIAFVGICLVLFASFQSWSIVLQILMAIPAGFVGGVLALTVAGEPLSISALVGFISLGGIAVRNGILLIEAYRRRQAELPEGTTDFSPAIVQGNLDRLAPVLMTTLTTGIALLPLVIGGTQPGKEVLYPVALVIVGGLLSSTLVEFLVRPGLYRFLGQK